MKNLTEPVALADVQPSAPVVEIVVPIYNEEKVLETSIRRLNAYLTASFPYSFLITIADNGSTDSSWERATSLAAELANVNAIRIEMKGRGLALRRAWTQSRAEIVAYTDVDLSIDIVAFLPLVAPLLSGHSDLSIGTRHANGSQVDRTVKRAVLSRTYNYLLRATLGARFTDAQCGFKAGRREVVQALLTAVDDNKWFFDTELLLVAQRNGLRIHEVPVDCLDDPDSSVDLWRTSYEDLLGLVRVARKAIADALHVQVPLSHYRTAGSAGGPWRLARLAVVGVLSTITYLLLFLILRAVTPAMAANAIALLGTAVLGTAVNRRFPLGIRGIQYATHHQLEAAGDFLIRVVLSSAVILAFQVFAPAVAATIEALAVCAVVAVAPLLRFLLIRPWRGARKRPQERPEERGVRQREHTPSR
ncbi:glycosyltransferase [Nonomuraea sp. NPDC049400]|uniref:glycosyltransferase n=1 Tax=Nonomuraea sp. NPDC049400 TaxID=3364352 RepID=UPI003792BC9F